MRMTKLTRAEADRALRIGIRTEIRARYADLAFKFAGVARDIRRPKPPPGIVRWLTQDEAGRLLTAFRRI